MSQKNSKKKSLRAKTKYPALDKKLNLKLRQDYIETEYVDGVFDEDGNQVMRPLTNEERDFLNRFNEEVVNANFLHDKELRDIHNDLKDIKRVENPTEEQIAKHDELVEKYVDRANTALLYPGDKGQKKLYGENNARNRCLFNRAKASNKLIPLVNFDNSEKELESSDYYDENSEKNIFIDRFDYNRKSKKED